MNLDEITFGNPTQEQIPFLKTETYADSLFTELATFSFPPNTSEATKEELNYIVDCMAHLEGKEEFISKYKAYDRMLGGYFVDGMERATKKGEEVKEIIQSILDDTLPLLTKLKYHFNRPRPFQLAEYYKVKLFPHSSRSADSPAFPSGHAFQTKLITEVLGNRYPQSYSFMQNVLLDICNSRIFMGLHYQSDIDVGIFAAEKVLGLKEFKEKYKL